MRLRYVGILAAAVAGMMFGGSNALASAVLSISDGTAANTFVIDDGSIVAPIDGAPAAGQISWTGTVGTFSLTVSTGSSKNIDGTAALPAGHLNVSATGVGTLYVTYSDDFYTGIAPKAITAFIGGANFLGSASYSVIAGPDNSTETLFPLGPTGTTLVGPLNLVGISGSSGTSLLPATGPYSLTQYAVIENRTLGTSSLDAGFGTIPVPVPAASWMGLSTLAGLAGMGVVRRRRLA